MNVLSLFDGMACGMIAMKNAGVNVEHYDAYEVDKHAIESAIYNFPEIIEHGDVFEADFTQFKNIDFLIGGSPCTYWSVAQKNNREIEASGLGWDLFCQYIRAVETVKPKFFIYENNNSMSDEIRQSIREAFGFEEIMINSSLVSAQNRKRLYWVGKRNEDGSYSKVNVKAPTEKGLVVKDILDDYQNSNVCCDTHEKFMKMTRVGCNPSPDGTLKGAQGNRIYSIYGKSVNLVANAGGGGGKTGLYAIPVDINSEKYNRVNNKFMSGSDNKWYDVYKVNNEIISMKGGHYPIKLDDGKYIVRKLTVSESKRLQTVPDWYEFPGKDGATMKMLGNGWTCDVITHLIKSCLEGNNT